MLYISTHVNSSFRILPRGIDNLTKTQFLYLSKNRFSRFNQVFKLTSNLLYLFPGEIPKEISNLIELELLSLAVNSFSDSLPMEIFKISWLRIIDLIDNNLSGSLPPNMCSILPNIEVLYLANLTNLVLINPHSISNCSKLKILELANNKLTDLIPNSLGYLTHLQFLNLGENNFTSDSSLSFLTSLTNCRNLTVLYLPFNHLNGMLPASMGNLSTFLRKFYANNYKIIGRIPNEVGNLSSLLDLDISGNNFVGLNPTSIGNLRNLQRFNLRNNKLTGFISDHICILQHLGDIYFGQNQLSASLPNCLGNIASLREIHLGSNKLSSIIPPSLGNLHDLVVLELSSNKI
ncbi:putative receptor-like protein kinase [Capsicum annuum]